MRPAAYLLVPCPQGATDLNRHTPGRLGRVVLASPGNRQGVAADCPKLARRREEASSGCANEEPAHYIDRGLLGGVCSEDLAPAAPTRASSPPAGQSEVISVRRGRKCFICRSDPDEHIVWRLTELQLGTVRQAERRAPIRPRLPLATGRRLVEALRNCCALRKCSRKGRQRLLRELLQLRMIAALDRSYKATISL